MILNWAINTRKVLKSYYCNNMERIYEADRSEILWLPNDLSKLKEKARKWVYNGTVTGCETGLRAADLVEVGRANFHPVDDPKFLKVKTHKRNRTVLIPITKELRRIIDQMRPDQKTIVVGKKAKRFPLAGYHSS